MIGQTASYFTNKELAMGYLQQIRELLPRYTRDHLQVILKALVNADKTATDKTLGFCLMNKLFNGHEFEQVLHVHLLENKSSTQQTPIKLLDKNNLEKVNQTPQLSNIQDYENIINQ